MPRHVFDASAVLAFLREEPGADVVARAMEGGDALMPALAMQTENAVVVTADRAWAAVPGFDFLFVR